MTKEELEKEADEYVTRTNNNDFTIEAYLAGAEPREKRIAELEAQNKNLQEMLQATRETRVNADYLKKITALEAQIEKMKCCCNCKHSRTEYEHCETDELEKWEIKEK